MLSISGSIFFSCKLKYNLDRCFSPCLHSTFNLEKQAYIVNPCCYNINDNRWIACKTETQRSFKENSSNFTRVHLNCMDWKDARTLVHCKDKSWISLFIQCYFLWFRCASSFRLPSVKDSLGTKLKGSGNGMELYCCCDLWRTKLQKY